MKALLINTLFDKYLQTWTIDVIKLYKNRVNLYVCTSVCLSVSKLFHSFISISRKLLSQFQPKTPKNIISLQIFKFASVKGTNITQGEIITMYWKYIDEFSDLLQNHDH